jgi:DNA-binding CsgD family transcriptional regulator
MSKIKITKRQQVINWFLKHPLATPKVVAEKFGMALPTVYTLRKQAMHEYQERNATQMLGPQIDEPQVVVEQAKDRQVGGDHYKEMGVQPWDVVDTWPRDQRIGYYRGGALKYLMRMGSKDESPIEVAKGQHYIQKLLEVLNEQD